MKPAPFDYYCPVSIDDALSVLHKHRHQAKVLAGGQSLGPMLNLRVASPQALIDINGIEALHQITNQGDFLEVGAAVTQADLLAWPELNKVQPLLAMMLPWIGHYQTRQRGTVCGSLAHSDPSAELPLALCLLNGEVILRSRKKKRVVKAQEFQAGPLQTSTKDDELIIAARFLKPLEKTVFRFEEVHQRHGDFAIVAIAVAVTTNTIRIGVGGVADTPQLLDIEKANLDKIEASLNEFAWQLGGADDIHATVKYRRHLVRTLGLQLIKEAQNELS